MRLSNLVNVVCIFLISSPPQVLTLLFFVYPQSSLFFLLFMFATFAHHFASTLRVLLVSVTSICDGRRFVGFSTGSQGRHWKVWTFCWLWDSWWAGMLFGKSRLIKRKFSRELWKAKLFIGKTFDFQYFVDDWQSEEKFGICPNWLLSNTLLKSIKSIELVGQWKLEWRHNGRLNFFWKSFSKVVRNLHETFWSELADCSPFLVWSVGGQDYNCGHTAQFQLNSTVSHSALVEAVGFIVVRRLRWKQSDDDCMRLRLVAIYVCSICQHTHLLLHVWRKFSIHANPHT